MGKSNMLIGGNNTGARAILNELHSDTARLYDLKWLLADPKDDRAVQFARILQERFATLRPQPLQLRAQDALAHSRDHDTVVLALDTIRDTLETLAARRASQRVTFQFAGRGPNGSTGTHLAIRGTICPGDQVSESQARLLLRTLGGMSQAVSSRQLTGPDPLAAAVLQPQRRLVSQQTAKHLGEISREPRDLSGSPLSVIFAQTIFPLVPVQGSSQDTYRHWSARALDTAGGLPAKHFADGRLVVVAVVIPDQQAIHFLRVAQSRSGNRSIAGVTTLARPPVTQQSTSINSAVFTD